MSVARRISASVMLQAVLLAGVARGQYGPPSQSYRGGGWDAPPQEYNDDLHRQAFHDGIEAARRDFQSQRPPDPAVHQEFRQPQVPFPARDAYREAYKRGYFLATQHLRGGAGGPPPPQAGFQPGYPAGGGGWDAPPADFADDLSRRAFHDGIDAARNDFQRQLPPNPASHEQFRHPEVPFPARETYREAFKKGYFVAEQHLRQGGPGPR